MGLLSSSVSVSRYKVNGKFESSAVESVFTGLRKNCIMEIDQQTDEKSVGWTSWQTPFQPDFRGSSFMIGTYFLFALRIDKKTLAAKTIRKHCSLEIEKRKRENGRGFLSSNEKKLLKEQIVQNLCRQIPATPNIYDLIWDYEKERLWLFSTLKSANEELEALFLKSFNLSLVRLFPYTQAVLASELSHSEQDRLLQLSPVSFREGSHA